MLKMRKSVMVLGGLMAALASVSAQAQLINMTTTSATKQVGYLGDYKGYFTTSFPPVWDGSSGTGTLDPFLSVQGNQGGAERGINSNGPYVYQEVNGGDRTRPLPRVESSTIKGVNIPGISVPVASGGAGQDCTDPTNLQCTRFYREFLLDANETKSNPYLIMSELKVFISKDPAQTPNPFDGQLSTLETWAANGTYNTVKAFDLDLQDTNGDDVLESVDRAVLINYALNGGSGNPDLVIYLPRIYTTDATHVYFYTRFGCTTTVGDANYDANCAAAVAAAPGATNPGDIAPTTGFEEWAVRATVVNQEQVPAPPVILGAFAAFGYMRKLRRRLKEHQARLATA